MENLQRKKGKWQAEVTLPDDESLTRKIVSLGAGFKVVSPRELALRVKNHAATIKALYE